MAGEKKLTDGQQRRILTEKLWLHYFNDYLLEKNMITETQRNRMVIMIENRKSTTSGISGRVAKEC